MLNVARSARLESTFGFEASEGSMRKKNRYFICYIYIYFNETRRVYNSDDWVKI